MPYLDRVVKEVLRWRPPIPMVFRSASEDVQLGGFLIPKGVNIKHERFLY